MIVILKGSTRNRSDDRETSKVAIRIGSQNTESKIIQFQLLIMIDQDVFEQEDSVLVEALKKVLKKM